MEHMGVGPATLAASMHKSRVDWDVLEERYHPLLQLVEKVLGVVPNCDRYLEIWPPAFRAYNLMVPNLLNLPVPILGLGGPPPGIVGLAMYVASRTACCPYCSAHSCSFAMRRGASPAELAAALLPEESFLDPGQLAAIAVARSLARVPCELTPDEKAELIDVYGEQSAEWIVLAVVMMGFLNKFMDALGVELEQDVVDEVADTIGADWSPAHAGADLDPASARRPAPRADGWRTRLELLPLLPRAVAYDRRVQRGMPSKAPAIATALRGSVGHDFPVLAAVRSNRARRAIASMLREILDPATSVLGMETKLRAGAAFAAVVGSASLAKDIQMLAVHAGVDLDDGAPEGAAVALARAASPSPAQVDAATIAGCEQAGLAAASVVEVVAWLAMLQLLHRLSCWAEPPSRSDLST